MTIIQLNKMTLYGAESRKHSDIEGLQELGCAHLVELRREDDSPSPADGAVQLREALKYLQACPEMRRQIRRSDRFDRQQIVADALNVKRREQELGDQRDDMRAAIQQLEPWGEFQVDGDGGVGGIRFWFYVVPLRQLAHVMSLGWLAREVSRDHMSAYVLILSQEQPQDIPGQPVELDRRPLSELRRQLEDLEERLEELHHQRVGLTRWCQQLAGVLDEAMDIAAQQRALRQTLNGQNVYALQAWIPSDATSRIERFASERRLAVTIEPPGPDDQPPTLLENPEALAGSESLVTFYKTPAYRAWDPSLLSYVSFAIFFAMIIADAGYGIVLAVLNAYFWKRMGRTRGGRRGRNILATIVGFTIVYGVICGSYFGIPPSAQSTLGRLQLVDAQSQAVMMPLTIAIGVVHLSAANLVMAWLQRNSTTALASLGWVAVMAGASLAGLGSVATTDEHLATQFTRVGGGMLIGGLVAVFLFSSRRPLASLSFKNHALRILDGLQGLTGISGLFGDVLSYLRLFALGLSSAKLSETFNDLGTGAWDAAGFGVIAAIAIVTLGHTLNLILGLMSGAVHGLRLNCIEFYKWSLPDEGYSFNAFAKKARQL